VLHDPDGFAQLLQYLTCRSARCSATRPTSWRCAARGAGAAHLPVDQGLGGRLQHRRGAYSLAILLREEGLLDRTILYATDINPARWTRRASRHLPLERCSLHRNYQKPAARGSFSDYYTAAYGGALFDKSLRDSITFADHSLATDSGVLRDAPGVVPQRADLLQPQTAGPRARPVPRVAVRTAASWAWAAKETLDFSPTPTVSSRGRPSASTASCMNEPAPDFRASVEPWPSAPRPAAWTRSSRCWPPAGALPRPHGHRAAPAGRPREPAGRSVRPPLDVDVREAQPHAPVARHALLRAAGYHLLVEADRTFSLSCDPPVHVLAAVDRRAAGVLRRRLRPRAGRHDADRRQRDGAQGWRPSRRAAA
jgi:hypothetical protein